MFFFHFIINNLKKDQNLSGWEPDERKEIPTRPRR